MTDTQHSLQETNPPLNLSGKIVLVTGASRGIGGAVALRYAQAGAHIIAVARSVGGLEALDDSIYKLTGNHATLVPLDLQKFDQIDQLGGQIYQRFGRLDILVANAAILGDLGPLAQSRDKIWHQTLNINLHANYRLIRSLDPLLRQSSDPHAIFVTSRVGHEVRANWNAYAVSKAALEMMARLYAQETKAFSVNVHLVDPGRTATSMRAQAFPGEKQDQLPRPEEVAEKFMAVLSAPGL